MQSYISSTITVSHDSSEIILICWFAAYKTFIIIIQVEHSYAETMIHFSEYFVV